MRCRERTPPSEMPIEVINTLIFVEHLSKFQFVDRKIVSVYFPVALLDTYVH